MARTFESYINSAGASNLANSVLQILLTDLYDGRRSEAASSFQSNFVPLGPCYNRLHAFGYEQFET